MPSWTIPVTALGISAAIYMSLRLYLRHVDRKAGRQVRMTGAEAWWHARRHRKHIDREVTKILHDARGK